MLTLKNLKASRWVAYDKDKPNEDWALRRVITYRNEKYMYNVKLARVTKKDGKNVCKNIQMKFIDCCRYMATRLDKLASTWIIIHSKIQASFTRETDKPTWKHSRYIFGAIKNTFNKTEKRRRKAFKKF